MNGIWFSILITLIFIIMFGSFLLFARFTKSQESKERENLLETALKTKLLDIEVHVVTNEMEILLFFYLGLIMLCGYILNLAHSIIFWDESTMDMLLFTPIVIIAPLMLIVIFWPYGRKGRLVISDKLIFLPEWTLRILPMKPTIFRIQNIESVDVHYKRLNKQKISMVMFGEKVWSTLRLSGRDYLKYEQVLSCLRNFGIKVKQ